MKEVVVITGAAGGIGHSFAEAYAKESRPLVLVDRNEGALSLLKEKINRDDVETLALDLTKEDSSQQILDFLKEKDFVCASLVHAAGLFSYQDLDIANPSKIKLIHTLHTTQPLDLTLALLPQIVSTGKGEIIAMASMARRVPFPGLNIYSATKAFVSNLMQSLHNELYSKGVKVLSCEPGAVDTTLYGLPEKYRRLALNLRVAITPEKLVKGAIKAARKGKTTYTPGLVNKVMLPIITHLPDPLIRYIDKFITRFKS